MINVAQTQEHVSNSEPHDLLAAHSGFRFMSQCVSTATCA